LEQASITEGSYFLWQNTGTSQSVQYNHLLPLYCTVIMIYDTSLITLFVYAQPKMEPIEPWFNALLEHAFSGVEILKTVSYTGPWGPQTAGFE